MSSQCSADSAVMETVLRRISRQERENPVLLRFLCDKFSISEDDILLCVNCVQDDTRYRVENVWRSSKYTLALRNTVMARRNVKSMCPCAEQYSRGEPVRHVYIVEYGTETTEYDVPFYHLFLFSTASVSLGVMSRCMHCGFRKYLFRYGREHQLCAKDVKNEHFLLHSIQNDLEHEFVSVEDDAWPNVDVLYTKYDGKFGDVFLSETVVTKTTDARFVSDVCLPSITAQDGPNVVFVQSPCGSGKSQFSVAAICQLFDLRRLPNGVFLPVATKAQAAAHTAAFQTAFPGFQFGRNTHPSDLKILHYRKDDNTVGQTCTVRLREPQSDLVTFGNLSSICTINSMVKHFQYYDKTSGQFKIHVPSLVWMDEVVSLLDALSLSEHMKTTEGGRSKAIKFFEHIVSRCDYIIATDAYLNTPCFEYVSELRRRANKIDRVEVVNFTSRYRINRCYVHHNREDEFLHHVAENIKAGNRCLVLSDSKAIITKVYNGIVQVCPQKKLKLYSADTADDIKDYDFEHCEDVWVDADALFSTPALTTGVNFTKRHFNNCFFFATGMSVSARTTLQMMNRVRCYLDKEIFVYSPVRYALDFMPTAEEEARVCESVLRDAEYESALAPDLQDQFYINEHNALVYEPIARMAISFLREHTESRRDYTHDFVRYAIFSGYDVYMGIPLARNSLAVSNETTPDAAECITPELAELECPVVQQAAIMLDAHQIKQVEKFTRLAGLELPSEWPKSVKNMTDAQQEISKMFALKFYTGLKPSDVVTPDYVEKFYDKSHFFRRLVFLDHLCKYSRQNVLIAREDCEAEFYKRLTPNPLYFVWGLLKVVGILEELGVLDYESVNQRCEDVIGEVEADFNPFPFGIGIDKGKQRNVLPQHIADHVKRNYNAYCKQFGKDVNRNELEREPTVYTIYSLFTAALSRIGIKVQTTKRARSRTLYSLRAKDECEIFVVRVLRPVILGVEQALHPTYNKHTLKLLVRFTMLTRDTAAWEKVHGLSFSRMADFIKQQ